MLYTALGDQSNRLTIGTDILIYFRLVFSSICVGKLKNIKNVYTSIHDCYDYYDGRARAYTSCRPRRIRICFTKSHYSHPYSQITYYVFIRKTSSSPPQPRSGRVITNGSTRISRVNRLLLSIFIRFPPPSFSPSRISLMHCVLTAATGDQLTDESHAKTRYCNEKDAVIVRYYSMTSKYNRDRNCVKSMTSQSRAAASIRGKITLRRPSCRREPCCTMRPGEITQ